MKFIRRYIILIALFGHSVNYIAQNSWLDSASVYEKNQDFNKAEYFYSLHLSSTDKIDSLYIVILQKKARSLRLNFKNHDALNTMLKAIELSKQINQPELLFLSQIQLADFYTLTQRFELAEEAFSNLVPLQNFSPLTKCIFLNRKAAYLNQIGDLEAATNYSNEALVIANKYNLSNEQAAIYNELGSIYDKQLEFNSALESFNKALKLYEKDKINYSNTYLNKAKIYINQKKYTLAISELTNNLNDISETNWSNLKCAILENLSRTYFLSNDSLNGYKLLAEYQKEANNFYLNNQNKTIAELETKFKTEQKNAEISKQKSIIFEEQQRQKTFYIVIISLILLLSIALFFYTTVKAKNKRLIKLLNENEFLVGEANHRIKNNLQLIVSLVAREKNKKENQNHEALTNIVTKIESIATLHQQLYINEEKNKINLKTYLNELCDNLLPLLEAKNIVLKKEFDDVLFSIEKSVYLGLILNELIINSLKHAFSERSTTPKEIHIQYKNINNKKIEFTYSDNGKGMSNKQEKPKLINLLCKQIKSECIIENSNGFYFKSEIKL
jgi:two-component sensor histidine kinase